LDFKKVVASFIAYYWGTI